ncbi:MAG: hypothetical protein NTX11_00790 [Candidatus Saccharibacteria bacterium]|nr:hypothetical protein [Candidatus Saccharibacteria bacterium]
MRQEILPDEQVFSAVYRKIAPIPEFVTCFDEIRAELSPVMSWTHESDNLRTHLLSSRVLRHVPRDPLIVQNIHDSIEALQSNDPKTRAEKAEESSAATAEDASEVLADEATQTPEEQTELQVNPLLTLKLGAIRVLIANKKILSVDLIQDRDRTLDNDQRAVEEIIFSEFPGWRFSRKSELYRVELGKISPMGSSEDAFRIVRRLLPKTVKLAPVSSKVVYPKV